MGLRLVPKDDQLAEIVHDHNNVVFPFPLHVDEETTQAYEFKTDDEVQDIVRKLGLAEPGQRRVLTQHLQRNKDDDSTNSHILKLEVA